jgi:hypothetical protein
MLKVARLSSQEQMIKLLKSISFRADRQLVVVSNSVNTMLAQIVHNPYRHKPQDPRIVLFVIEYRAR